MLIGLLLFVSYSLQVYSETFCVDDHVSAVAFVLQYENRGFEGTTCADVLAEPNMTCNRPTINFSTKYWFFHSICPKTCGICESPSTTREPTSVPSTAPHIDRFSAPARTPSQAPTDTCDEMTLSCGLSFWDGVYNLHFENGDRIWKSAKGLKMMKLELHIGVLWTIDNGVDQLISISPEPLQQSWDLWFHQQTNFVLFDHNECYEDLLCTTSLPTHAPSFAPITSTKQLTNIPTVAPHVFDINDVDFCQEYSVQCTTNTDYNGIYQLKEPLVGAPVWKNNRNDIELYVMLMVATPNQHHWVFSEVQNHLFVVSEEDLPSGTEPWIEDRTDLELEHNTECYASIVCDDTFTPSFNPTVYPSVFPSTLPSRTPSKLPSRTPSSLPTDVPSSLPTDVPSLNPTSPTTTLTETQIPVTDAPIVEQETTEVQTERPATEAPPTTEAQTKAPVTEEASTEAPTTEEPATEQPTTEAQTEQPSTEAPETETPATEAPETKAPATEAPATEEPATEMPETEAPATDAPATEIPVTDAPATEAPATEAPETESPATEVPATESPATEEPVTEAPATEVPETEAPATAAPETEAPTTEAPETEAPATEAPETEAPEIEAPVTETPATEAPETEAPTTEAPVTETPETEAPETEAPATEAPETEAPKTEAPVTEAPATEAPVTEAPATEAPVTEAPATEAPVTEAPATEEPATEEPSTEVPATEEPETEAPATEVPETEVPIVEVPTSIEDSTTTTATVVVDFADGKDEIEAVETAEDDSNTISILSFNIRLDSWLFYVVCILLLLMVCIFCLIMYLCCCRSDKEVAKFSRFENETIPVPLDDTPLPPAPTTTPYHSGRRHSRGISQLIGEKFSQSSSNLLAGGHGSFIGGGRRMSSDDLVHWGPQSTLHMSDSETTSSTTESVNDGLIDYEKQTIGGKTNFNYKDLYESNSYQEPKDMFTGSVNKDSVLGEDPKYFEHYSPDDYDESSTIIYKGPREQFASYDDRASYNAQFAIAGSMDHNQFTPQYEKNKFLPRDSSFKYPLETVPERGHGYGRDSNDPIHQRNPSSPRHARSPRRQSLRGRNTPRGSEVFNFNISRRISRSGSMKIEDTQMFRPPPAPKPQPQVDDDDEIIEDFDFPAPPTRPPAPSTKEEKASKSPEQNEKKEKTPEIQMESIDNLESMLYQKTYPSTQFFEHFQGPAVEDRHRGISLAPTEYSDASDVFHTPQKQSNLLGAGADHTNVFDADEFDQLYKEAFGNKIEEETEEEDLDLTVAGAALGGGDPAFMPMPARPTKKVEEKKEEPQKSFQNAENAHIGFNADEFNLLYNEAFNDGQQDDEEDIIGGDLDGEKSPVSNSMPPPPHTTQNETKKRVPGFSEDEFDKLYAEAYENNVEKETVEEEQGGAEIKSKKRNPRQSSLRESAKLEKQLQQEAEKKVKKRNPRQSSLRESANLQKLLQHEAENRPKKRNPRQSSLRESANLQKLLQQEAENRPKKRNPRQSSLRESEKLQNQLQQEAENQPRKRNPRQSSLRENEFLNHQFEEMTEEVGGSFTDLSSKRVPSQGRDKVDSPTQKRNARSAKRQAQTHIEPNNKRDASAPKVSNNPFEQYHDSKRAPKAPVQEQKRDASSFRNKGFDPFELYEEDESYEPIKNKRGAGRSQNQLKNTPTKKRNPRQSSLRENEISQKRGPKTNDSELPPPPPFHSESKSTVATRTGGKRNPQNSIADIGIDVEEESVLLNKDASHQKNYSEEQSFFVAE